MEFLYRKYRLLVLIKHLVRPLSRTAVSVIAMTVSVVEIMYATHPTAH